MKTIPASRGTAYGKERSFHIGGEPAPEKGELER